MITNTIVIITRIINMFAANVYKNLILHMFTCTLIQQILYSFTARI